MQQLLFSLSPSILMFDFDLILGLFLTLLGSTGLFLGSMWGSKTVLRSTPVVEQFSFCMFSPIQIFDFYLILGLYLTFWGPSGAFLGLG